MSVMEALGLAWKRTVYLLWEKGSWRRWLCFGVLAGAAAGGMISPPATLTELRMMGLSPSSIFLACGIFTLLTLGLGFLCAVARFVMLEDLVFDRHEVLEPGFRFGGLGGRLFGVQIAVFAVNLLFMAMGSASLSSSPSLLRGIGAGTDLLALLRGFGLSVLSWFFLRCISVLIDEMLAPTMYCAQCRPTEAARRWLAMARKEPAAVLSWALVRFFLGLACGFVFLAFASACLFGTSLLVGIVALPLMMLMNLEADNPVAVGMMMLTAAATCLAFLPQLLILSAPGIVLLKLFSIYSLQSIDEEIEMLPLSGRGTIDDEVPALGQLESSADAQSAGHAQTG